MRNIDKGNFCRHGHDLLKYGRNSQGICNACITCRKWKQLGILNVEGEPFSREDYDKLYQAQGGCCTICNKPQDDLEKALAADHNHETGIVRGLLCPPCNLRVGVFEVFKNQIENYLNKFNVNYIY